MSYEVLNELAREACKAHPANGKAMDELRRAVRNDADAMQQAVDLGCATAVHQARAMVRSVAKGHTQHSKCGHTAAAIKATAGAVLTSILDSWGFADGRTLGDMTGTDLLAQAQDERAKAEGYLVNSRFYESLAKIAGPRTVRSVVDGATAQRMFETAQKGETKGGRAHLRVRKSENKLVPAAH